VEGDAGRGDEGPAAIQHLLGAVAEGAVFPAFLLVDPPPVAPRYLVGLAGDVLFVCTGEFGRGGFGFSASVSGGSFLVALAGSFVSEHGPVSYPVWIPPGAAKWVASKWGIFVGYRNC